MRFLRQLLLSVAIILAFAPAALAAPKSCLSIFGLLHEYTPLGSGCIRVNGQSVSRTVNQNRINQRLQSIFGEGTGLCHQHPNFSPNPTGFSRHENVIALFEGLEATVHGATANTTVRIYVFKSRPNAGRVAWVGRAENGLSAEVVQRMGDDLAHIDIVFFPGQGWQGRSSVFAATNAGFFQSMSRPGRFYFIDSLDKTLSVLKNGGTNPPTRNAMVRRTGPVSRSIVGFGDGYRIQRPNEVPYIRPPTMGSNGGHQVQQVWEVTANSPFRVQDLEPNVRYIWVVSEDGTIWIGRENPFTWPRPSDRPARTTLKHRDLIPNSSGNGGANGRICGEMYKDSSGRMHIDPDGSYTFARVDGADMRMRERVEAVVALMRLYGSDVGNPNIVTRINIP